MEVDTAQGSSKCVLEFCLSFFTLPVLHTTPETGSKNVLGRWAMQKWTLHSTSRFVHSFSHWLMFYVVWLAKQSLGMRFLPQTLNSNVALFTRLVFFTVTVHSPMHLHRNHFGVRQHSEHSLCTGASGFISAVTGWPRWPSTGASRPKRMDTSDPGALTSP